MYLRLLFCLNKWHTIIFFCGIFVTHCLSRAYRHSIIAKVVYIRLQGSGLDCPSNPVLLRMLAWLFTCGETTVKCVIKILLPLHRYNTQCFTWWNQYELWGMFRQSLPLKHYVFCLMSSLAFCARSNSSNVILLFFLSVLPFNFQNFSSTFVFL